ncbi:MAG: hypothetical protein ACD_46C00063G0003 [uncultured bacterium]|nr:MAG: hypothetical protein ACD_46C00063G0003 [uncultured bacterium]
MAFLYTAKIYVDDTEIAHESGDDVEALHTWMLMKTQGQYGNFHGEVIDNKTKKIIRSFRKSPPD